MPNTTEAPAVPSTLRIISDMPGLIIAEPKGALTMATVREAQELADHGHVPVTLRVGGASDAHEFQPRRGFNPRYVTGYDIRGLVESASSNFERIAVNGTIFYDRQTGELIAYDGHQQSGQHFTRFTPAIPE